MPPQKGKQPGGQEQFSALRAEGGKARAAAFWPVVRAAVELHELPESRGTHGTVAMSRSTAFSRDFGPRIALAVARELVVCDATGKILAAQFFPTETIFGYLCLLRQLLRRRGVPLAFYGDHSGIFVRNDDGWTVQEQLSGKRQPTQFCRALNNSGHLHRGP